MPLFSPKFKTQFLIQPSPKTPLGGFCLLGKNEKIFLSTRRAFSYLLTLLKLTRKIKYAQY
jgi:hypothetical protein